MTDKEQGNAGAVELNEDELRDAQGGLLPAVQKLKKDRVSTTSETGDKIRTGSGNDN